MNSYYDTLGVQEDATPEEIKTAYRKLAMKLHPDKNNGDMFFKKIFIRVHEAYDTLSNTVKRKEYDQSKQRPDRNNYRRSRTSKFIYFTVNKSYFYTGEELEINWDVSNAYNVQIEPFGHVTSSGEKIIKLKKHSDDMFKITLVAIGYDGDVEKRSISILNLGRKPFLKRISDWYNNLLY